MFLVTGCTEKSEEVEPVNLPHQGKNVLFVTTSSANYCYALGPDGTSRIDDAEL